MVLTNYAFSSGQHLIFRMNPMKGLTTDFVIGLIKPTYNWISPGKINYAISMNHAYGVSQVNGYGIHFYKLAFNSYPSVTWCINIPIAPYRAMWVPYYAKFN